MEYFTNLLDNALSRTVAQKIMEQILNGELKPGDQIVESTYAEMFNTSRSPIREAIYLLSTEGLIERVPRKGAFIKGYTLAEVQDLLDVRNSLEILAAQRIKEPQKKKTMLNDMKKIVRDMEKCSNQMEYTHLNYAFHFTLIKFSESTVIESVYSKISLPLLRIQGIHFSINDTMEKSRKEHRRIYELLKDNQLDELISILRKHTEDVIFNVRRQIL
ncbi:GntR family transcriptional regulator [Lysinibacillus agricola]|uniref:GntR family transcriptional regulator n=1 Tax=Lysinibacillus agricola TaxID=2590012 RepID=A0ABX7AV97_9BACI|nr:MULTISPECIES: GntR family transcriptional regulator [Lysinibacillus]KOS62923.1 GntR family transcriptional regulator [Lysinibacillus sp. FJAT-14222]QQP13891.1 GntR family transcriptional regulator [Lysinibacillus agricola]